MRLGEGLLPGASPERAVARLCVALPGAALAEDPLEDVANPHALRRGAAYPQPDATRLLAPDHEARSLLMKKAFSNQRTSFCGHQVWWLGSMTAAVLEGVEKPVVLQDVADPVAASGFAIVRLKAAALNHRDLWIQKGRLVVYGATAGNPPGFEARRVFFRQISVLGSTMGSPEDFAGITRLVGERR